MKFSKLNELALKTKKVYSPIDSNWHCYYHALSGEELKNQVITIAHKNLDKVESFSYQDITAPYKMNEDQGLYDFIKQMFDVSIDEIIECSEYVKQFYDDARIEYLGKPFFNVFAEGKY
jgi:hypothetical protein